MTPPERPNTGSHRPVPRQTRDLPPTQPSRGKTEPPDSDAYMATPPPILGAPEWVRLLQGQQAQSEGRLMAEIVAVEERLTVAKVEEKVKEKTAQLSSELTMTTQERDAAKRVVRLMRWATAGGSGTAAIALVALLARACGPDEETRRRVDELEGKLDRVLELLEPLPERRHR